MLKPAAQKSGFFCEKTKWLKEELSFSSSYKGVGRVAVFHCFGMTHCDVSGPRLIVVYMSLSVFVFAYDLHSRLGLVHTSLALLT